MKRIERAFSLLIAVLMITASFIPAVSAIESENNVSDAVVATDDAAGITVLTSGTATLFVDDSGGADFTTIQAAVNAASNGDQIVVKAGSYTENVVVNKSVSLTSEAGAGVTTVTAASSNSPVFRVDADNVTITGFRVSGSTAHFGAIHLCGDNCTVSNNIITGNRVGIYADFSSHVVLTGNTISSNSWGGIWLVGARAVTVDGNTIDSNGGEGGVYIDYVFDTVIRNNIVSNNSYAIVLEDWGDDSSAIYLNTFTNNGLQTYAHEGHFSWQSPDLVTYSYNGQSFTSLLGNCWDNYIGTDADGDGIGDTPYAIGTRAQDPYPLMGAWQNGTIASPAGPTAITIISPWDDTVGAGDNVTVAGNVSDTAVTSLTLTHNSVSSAIPVEDGNFSAVVNLTAANTIVVSGVDSQGIPLSATLLLDGDMLPAAFEQAIGFDPLNADSDCSQWPGNQSGNGVIDGYEIFAGDLPVFAKYRIGADPFVTDTDADGLTDSFELLKLGTFPEEPGQMLMMGEGDPVVVAAGTGDDPDGDGLSNLDEQTYGTDPLSADSDDDGLADADEILMGTNPCDADSDDDGLDDGAEVAIGTNPLNPDSNGNGVADGAEDYWSGDRFLDETLNLTVFGQGYAIANVSVAAVNYTHLISEEILVSKVYDIGFGDDISSAELEIRYDSIHVNLTDNLSIYQFDATIGTFVPVQSVVDTSNEIVSCQVTNSSKYAVLNSLKWDALFEDPIFETGTFQTAGLAGSTDALSESEYLDEEHYIPAVDERYPVTTPPEVELVEGVDYGAFTYNETPEWLIEELNESDVLFEIDNLEIDPVVLSSEDVLYQAVSNGHFSNGMADWAPNGRDYLEGAGYGHDINISDQGYSSAPCLSIFLSNSGQLVQTHSYEVAHANVDLTGVDVLTFKYNCPFFEKGRGLTAARLKFMIDGGEKYIFPTLTTVAYETDGWQSQSIDVSGYTGMHTISFEGYLYYNDLSNNERSKIEFLIDDVSAWSVQKPAAPDTASVRFFVRDSQTGEGVGSAYVSCNNEVKHADSNGYTNDFLFTSSGTYGYTIEAAGYRNHEGSIQVTLGESKVVDAVVNDVNAPIGTIYVTSIPTQATIYVDGIFSRGTNNWVTDVLAGNHVVEVRKEGYNPANRTVTVNDHETTTVHFDLTAPTGTIAVTSSPPGAAVYLDTAYQGTTSAASGQLTLSSIPIGAHRVDVLKDGYAPFTATVTVADGQTAPVTADLTDEDLDEDGLPDGFESGYRDGFGNWHAPDSSLIDSDGDGLSDGYEAGEMVIDANGKTYFKQRSDPTKADTDDDGLDDLAEFEYGTDPFSPDTDGDGLLDGADPDPLTPAASGAINLAQIAREILAGAVFGETGLPDGSFYWLVGEETASSPYYMVGWIGFSCLPVVGGIADIRDAVQAIINGDAIGAAMNAAGAIPGPGDGVKITGAIVCYTGKFPWKARELGLILSKEILGAVPDALKIQVWDLLFDGAGTALRDTHSVPVSSMSALTQKSVDLAHVREFFDATFGGGWVTRKGMTNDEYIAEHFGNHGHEFNPPILTEAEYKQKATTLISRRDGGVNGVELYYQEGHDTLLVRDKITKEIASGTKDGLIVTYFLPTDAYWQSIQSRLTRLN